MINHSYLFDEYNKRPFQKMVQYHSYHHPSLRVLWAFFSYPCNLRSGSGKDVIYVFNGLFFFTAIPFFSTMIALEYYFLGCLLLAHFCFNSSLFFVVLSEEKCSFCGYFLCSLFPLPIMVFLLCNILCCTCKWGFEKPRISDPDRLKPRQESFKATVKENFDLFV